MHFEQSIEWARFQQAMGRRVFILSPSTITPFQEGMKFVDGEGVVVERDITGGLCYLEVNGWDSPSGEIEKTMSILRDAVRRTGAVFVRWTPLVGSKLKVQSLKFAGERVVTPQIFVHQVPPKVTLVIDLSKKEEELLGAMHEKTRYNIRLAERKGVEVRHASIDEGFEAFWSLMQETAARDKIGIHPKEYYRNMVEIVQGEEAQTHLFLATYEGAPLATAIVIICGDTATYLHGGSSSKQRNSMAPQLLQWRMMQFAKAHGCRWYDMWGIAPQDSGFRIQDSGTHPWAGITRFKRGFGGEIKEGAGTFDVICRPFVYNVLSLGRMLKRLF